MIDVFRPTALTLDKNEVLRYLGYKRTQLLPPQIDEQVDKAITLAPTWVQSAICWDTYPYQPEQALVTTPKGICQLRGNGVNKHLTLCTKVTLLAVTIGIALEQEVDRLFHCGEYTMATLLDAVGTEAVEKTADFAERLITQQAAKQGFSLTKRFSPGYGDWPLIEQKLFFGALPFDKMNMSLTPHYQLEPRKSVTAIIGWHSCAKPNSAPSRCDTCTQRDCQFTHHQEG